MSKRLSPPLYEVMVRRSEGVVRRDPRGQDADEPNDPMSRLRLGRSVRVPLGYLFLGAAGALVLLVVAYVLGASRGRDAARAELEDYLVGGDLGAVADRAQDPLGSDPLSEVPGRLPDRDSASSGAAAPPAGPPTAAGGTNPGWGPLQSDPRREGLHYWVLAETRPEGALRLAEFCRAEGLEAYVVRRHNSRFARVLVLPGFASRSDPGVQRMKQEVLRIGLVWKARYPAENSDLSDAYLIP